MPRPSFIEVKGGVGVRPSRGPRLGVQPNYDSTDGVEVENVVAGGVAERGGIKKGDKILTIAGQETKTLRQYMQAMAQQKSGATIEIVVQRDKKEVKLKVKLD
jgi:serine protease Do